LQARRKLLCRKATKREKPEKKRKTHKTEKGKRTTKMVRTTKKWRSHPARKISSETGEKTEQGGGGRTASKEKRVGEKLTRQRPRD